MNLGNTYLIIKRPDSSFVFAKEAEQITLHTGLKKYLGQIYSILGEISMDKGEKVSAKQYFDDGVQASIEQNNLSSLSRNYLRLIRYYLAEGQKDSSLYCAVKHLQTIQAMGPILGLESNIGTAYEVISQLQTQKPG